MKLKHKVLALAAWGFLTSPLLTDNPITRTYITIAASMAEPIYSAFNEEIKFGEEKFGTYDKKVYGNYNLKNENGTFRGIGINSLDAKKLNFYDLIKIKSMQRQWPKGVEEFTQNQAETKIKEYLWNRDLPFHP